MFTGAMRLIPGREAFDFDVYRNGEYITASGRPVSNGGGRIGGIRAVLASARPEEKERWRQLEHPVSHKIIQRGAPPFELLPGDSLVRGDKRYIVQAAPYNVGGINHWTVYFCEERSDV